ncbi:MAG: hypothetical protein V9E85_14055 [Candidatus Nanopelagicales bacterium]
MAAVQIPVATAWSATLRGSRPRGKVAATPADDTKIPARAAWEATSRPPGIRSQ